MSAYPFKRDAPKTQAILDRLSKVESRSMHGQLPVVWDAAHDYRVADIEGNTYIDFSSGIFVANVGHANTAVNQAIRNATFQHAYTYPTEIRLQYLERLTAWSGFDKAFLLSSGTEATECALKLMRLYGERDKARKVFVVDGAFHGRTMGAQLMGKSDYWTADDPNIIRLPYPDKEPYSIPFHVGVCGIMLETFEGWSAKFYPQRFVDLVRLYCKHHNVLLCFDEMQAGFGRTGKKFGYEHYGVKPDLICVGKGMGNGVPLSGVLGRADILDLPDVGSMSSTHSANPLVCAAGLAVIEEIERLDLVREAERKGILMRNVWNLYKPSVDYPLPMVGKGMVGAVHLPTPEMASKVAERCMQKGLLVVHTGRETVKIGPPLTIPDDALLEGISVLKEAIGEVVK